LSFWLKRGISPLMPFFIGEAMRWLAGNEQDAEDIVQESDLRAVKFFGSFRGGNPRAWLLTFVSNTSYTWLKRRKEGNAQFNLDEREFEIQDNAANPAMLQAAMASVEKVRNGIAQLLRGIP
jgi:DNA-directed RNA polymerase specialized sigma24 family protein